MLVYPVPFRKKWRKSPHNRRGFFLGISGRLLFVGLRQRNIICQHLSHLSKDHRTNEGRRTEDVWYSPLSRILTMHSSSFDVPNSFCKSPLLAPSRTPWAPCLYKLPAISSLSFLWLINVREYAEAYWWVMKIFHPFNTLAKGMDRSWRQLLRVAMSSTKMTKSS